MFAVALSSLGQNIVINLDGFRYYAIKGKFGHCKMTAFSSHFGPQTGIFEKKPESRNKRFSVPGRHKQTVLTVPDNLSAAWHIGSNNRTSRGRRFYQDLRDSLPVRR